MQSDGVGNLFHVLNLKGARLLELHFLIHLKKISVDQLCECLAEFTECYGSSIMLYHLKILTYILLLFLIKCGQLNFVGACRLWIMVFVNYGSTTMLGYYICYNMLNYLFSFHALH